MQGRALCLPNPSVAGNIVVTGGHKARPYIRYVYVISKYENKSLAPFLKPVYAQIF